jgi:TPR repeat protein
MGNAAAKNKIGDCYYSGFGVSEDQKLAIKWYSEAAQLNNSDALVNLGTIYLNGIPGLIERDYKKAKTYFVRA